MEPEKSALKEFWNEASCGEELYFKGNNNIEAYNNQLKERYLLEPYIIPFAGFNNVLGKKVLEIGVGMGADHQKFAEGGAELYGIDLTERAIENTSIRMSLFNLHSNLTVGDAEKLQFENSFFDLVYSWGVIHHSPDTQAAVREIHRVLKPGSEARIMIYHKKSIVGYMLWIRYALLKFKPFTSLGTIYSKYLESPGTQAYTVKEAHHLFKDFSDVNIETTLTHGDLLSSAAGQQHEGFSLSLARKLYPRFVVRSLFPKHGLFMLIKAKK